MARPPRLTDSDLRAALEELPGWSAATGTLHRVFRFHDFSEAFAFMTRVALEAEKRDHHPDWSNAFATVTVDLSTHDAGGITRLDFELAREMDRLASPGPATTSSRLARE
ncbi:MAG: 4a-hydroxytetrahydrobiopterin dehydratase [Candidatus Lutacidiplasmatales archaeon]